MSGTEEIRSGLLIMGMSNTVFFGEGVVHEIVLVNLETGQDFSMPISEEQAALIYSQLGGVSEEPQEQTSGGEDAAEKSAWGETEITPQL